jgi:putative ABC transport system permease protein
MPLAEFVEGTIVRAAIFMLLSAVGMVLLIACANIANLQLARATGREREIAVRTALGASRLRIVRLLLWENLLLGAIGGAASLLFSGWCLSALLRSMPSNIARLMPGFQTIRLDGRAMIFTMAIALGAGILFGLAPALGNSRADLNDGLKEGSRGATVSRAKQRLRSVFVVAQVAVALVLLVMAGIYVRTFRAMLHTGDVFAPQQVLVMGVNLPEARYGDAAARARFYREAIERLSAMPGTQVGAAFTSIPMSNNGVTWSAFQVEGRPEPDEAHAAGSVLQDISPDYLKFMRIQMVEGREFNSADTESTVPVALVSQKLAERYFPNESALGKRISVGSVKDHGPQLTIVGVVGDALYDWTDRAPEAAIYRPVSQSAPAESQLGIRVNGDPREFVGAVRTQLAAIDPLLPAYDVMPLSEAIEESLSGNPQLAGMMSILGVLALVIAVVGVYGIVAYSVAQRMHEFGVRMALGAERRDIFMLVMRNGALLTMAGLAIGIPSALYVMRGGGELVRSGNFDYLTFLVVPILLMAATLLACYVPAARATRVDPIQALRYE